MKCCRDCKQEKELVEFHKKTSSPDGKQSICKKCLSVRNARWHAANSQRRKECRAAYDKKNWAKVQAHKRKYNYGISEEEFNKMLIAQQNLCAICGGYMKKACVDHDHKTEKIRELLCMTCNWGLGQFKDSPELLKKAAIYLEKHR